MDSYRSDRQSIKNNRKVIVCFFTFLCRKKKTSWTLIGGNFSNYTLNMPFKFNPKPIVLCKFIKLFENVSTSNLLIENLFQNVSTSNLLIPVLRQWDWNKSFNCGETFYLLQNIKHVWLNLIAYIIICIMMVDFRIWQNLMFYFYLMSHLYIRIL